jgi:hypothetical protein
MLFSFPFDSVHLRYSSSLYWISPKIIKERLCRLCMKFNSNIFHIACKMTSLYTLWLLLERLNILRNIVHLLYDCYPWTCGSRGIDCYTDHRLFASLLAVVMSSLPQGDAYWHGCHSYSWWCIPLTHTLKLAWSFEHLVGS